MKQAIVIIGCLLALAVLAATQNQYISGNLTVAGNVGDPSGVLYLKDAPLGATNWVRSNGVWVVLPPLGGGGGGISDAPSDGVVYGREDAAWVNLYSYFSELGHGHSISDVSGLSDALDARALVDHDHLWADITDPPDVSLNGHTHAASDVVSGTFDPARLGSGTASAAVFLRGDMVWATVPEGGGGTNGITDAPNDGSFYGRKSAGWVNPVAGDIGSGTFNVARLGSGTSGTTKFLRGGASTGSWDPLSIVDISDVTDFGGTFLGAMDPAGGRGVLELGDSATLDVGTGSGDVAAGDHGHNVSEIADAVPASRTVATTQSLTGGGDLSANRTLSLVNDETTPAASKYYGTSGAGTRGWHNLAGSHTHPDLANHVFVTVTEVSDANEDTTFRSVLGAVKTGYSSTIPSGTLAAETVLKVEAAGRFAADGDFNHKVRLKIGSSYYLEWVCNETAGGVALSGTPWNLTAWVTIVTAGSSATVVATGWMEYHTDEGVLGSVPEAASIQFRTRATPAGTLNTTVNNAVDLTYAGMSSTATSFSCSHFILQQF